MLAARLRAVSLVYNHPSLVRRLLRLRGEHPSGAPARESNMPYGFVPSDGLREIAPAAFWRSPEAPVIRVVSSSKPFFARFYFVVCTTSREHPPYRIVTMISGNEQIIRDYLTDS